MTDDRTSRLLAAALPAEGILDALLDQPTVGVAVLDHDLRYVRVNDALAAMSRLTPAEHLGRTVGEVLPESVESVEPLLRRALAGEPVHDVEFTAHDAATDEDRRFRASYVPVAGPGGEVIGAAALVAEVTRERAAARALRVTQERLALALEATGTGTWEWDTATDRIHWSDNLGELWGRERGWAPQDFAAFLATLHPDDRDRLSGAVARALEDGSAYEVQFRMLRPDGELRWMSTRGHVVRDARGRPEAMVGLVSDVHERRLRELADAQLAEATLVLGRSLDPDATLQRLAELAIGELADWCAVHVREADGSLRTVGLAHHDPAMVSFARELDRRYPPDPAAPTGVAAVLRTGRAELYAEITDEMLVAGAADEEHLRIARSLELRSAMVVPIPAGVEVLGAITFCFAGERRRYTPQLLALAEELGRRAGLALANARLHRAQQEANRELRDLQSITDVALSRLGLDDLLRELLTRTRAILGTDVATCLLLDEDEDVLRVRASVGLEQQLAEEVRVPVGAGVAGRIVLGDEPVVIDDVPAARPVSRALRSGVRSLLGAPLRVDGRALGVLHVSTFQPRRFTDRDAELLRLVADRVGRAVAHASAYDAVRRTALTLQRSLLPAILPSIEGLESAARYLPGQEGAEVGGDWYDVVALHDGRSALCVGDVVGRGVPAAAVMGHLRSTLRALLHVAPGPAAALEQLDGMVAEADDLTFATLVLVVVDPAGGRLELCSAGHPPPVLRTPEGCRLLDVPPGRPIGAPPAPRRSVGAELPQGGTLLLYTDGLVETRDGVLEDRLEELRAAMGEGPPASPALLDHVLTRLLGSRPPHDDVAALAVWRT